MQRKREWQIIDYIFSKCLLFYIKKISQLLISISPQRGTLLRKDSNHSDLGHLIFLTKLWKKCHFSPQDQTKRWGGGGVDFWWQIFFLFVNLLWKANVWHFQVNGKHLHVCWKYPIKTWKYRSYINSDQR